MRIYLLFLSAVFLTNLGLAQVLLSPRAEFEKIKAAMRAGSYTSYKVDVELSTLTDTVIQVERETMEVFTSSGQVFLKTADFDLYAEPEYSILMDHADETITIAKMSLEAFQDKQLEMFQAMIKEPGMVSKVNRNGNYREIEVTAPGVSWTRYVLRYVPETYHLISIELTVDPNVELAPQYQNIVSVKAQYTDIKNENQPFPFSRAYFIKSTKEGVKGIGKLNTYQVDAQ